MPLDPSAITAGMNLGQSAGGRFGALNDSLGTLVNFLIQQKQMKDKMASESQMKMRDAAISSGRATLSPEQMTALGLTPAPTPSLPTGAEVTGGTQDPVTGAITNTFKVPQNPVKPAPVPGFTTVAGSGPGGMTYRQVPNRPAVTKVPAITGADVTALGKNLPWMGLLPSDQKTQYEDARKTLAGKGKMMVPSDAHQALGLDPSQYDVEEVDSKDS